MPISPSSEETWVILHRYSIVKDSNADSGVIFKFLQNPPISMAGCTEISKTWIFGNILILLRENKEVLFLLF